MPQNITPPDDPKELKDEYIRLRKHMLSVVPFLQNYADFNIQAVAFLLQNLEKGIKINSEQKIDYMYQYNSDVIKHLFGLYKHLLGNELFPYDPRKFEGLENATSSQLNKAVTKLEKLKFIEVAKRGKEGRNRTHIKLTELGLMQFQIYMKKQVKSKPF